MDRSLGFGSRLLMRLGLRMWRILGSSRRYRTGLALWTGSCLLRAAFACVAFCGFGVAALAVSGLGLLSGFAALAAG